MATSGTFTFAPSTADLIVYAFGRCQIRRPALTAEHLKDAAMSCNLLQVDWSVRGINLWTVDLASEVLVEGQSEYDVDPTTVMIMAAYIETTQNDQPVDRIITPVGRDEYAAFPNKTTTAPPTCFWFDRTIEPTITVWQPPDDNGPYTLKYYRARQIQDASLAGGLQPEIPYRFLDAYAWALALKLAHLYAVAEVPRLEMAAEKSWKLASDQDVEDVPLYLVPGMSGYFR